LVPYHFEFDPATGIARCRLEGVLVDEEMKRCYRQAGEFFATIDPRGGIFDLSAVTSFEVSSKMVHELANSLPILPDPSRPRVVVAPSPAAFGMARMFEIVGESTRPNLHVVRTNQEAFAILGVWDPQFEPYPK
jgi:hypothetical protein